MNTDRFRSALLAWYEEHRREMPWRDIDDPYHTWVSEIMLQQTRVDQAAPYYRRFIERFPTVHALAEADRQTVLKAWEGLGYYSRARYLHDASRMVVEEFEGVVPDTWNEIISLKGVGPYTAAAVLSIAYGKPHAVVDGNVIRVLARYSEMEGDTRRGETKRAIQELADDLIDPARPGDFNQALMELGATVCIPAGPQCGDCPLQEGCVAYRTARTDTIPFRSSAKKPPHHRIGTGIIFNDEGEVLIALRPEDKMLGGLWEFPGGKQQEDESVKETVVRELREELGVEVTVLEPFMELDHAYSHFKITLHAWICRLHSGTPSPLTSQEVRWVPVEQLGDLPFPKANRRLTEKLMNDMRQSGSSGTAERKADDPGPGISGEVQPARDSGSTTGKA